MAEPADLNVDELRRRARRRLVGAVVLALGVAVVVPMLLETEQKPLGEDVSVKIPPVDSGKFVNRLNEGAAKADAPDTGVPARPDDATKATPPPLAPSDTPPPRAQKYDTRVPDSASDAQATSNAAAASATPSTPAPQSASPATLPEAAPAAPTQAPAVKSASEGVNAVETPPRKPSDGGKSAHAGEAAKTAYAADTARPVHGSSATPPREGYAVQLAAFADDRGANSLAGRLKKAGYAAYTEPLKTSKGTLGRVRVGPYSSREAAQAARDKLRNEGQSGIVAPVK